MSDDLDALRKKRERELKESLARQQEDVQQQRQQEEAQEAYEQQKQAILRTILTDSAKQRLSNIKLVKPQMAEGIENQLIQLSQMGRISGGKINEEQLLQMLKQLQQGKRESNIRFKRR